MNGVISFVMSDGCFMISGDSKGAMTLARWLDDDIQSGVDSIVEWISIFTRVESGLLPPGYFGTGNAHSVMSTAEYVYIESEYVSKNKVLILHRNIIDVLSFYLSLLSDEWVRGEASLSVDYIAEDEDARDLFISSGGSFA